MHNAVIQISNPDCHIIQIFTTIWNLDNTKVKQNVCSIWIVKTSFSETGPFLPHFPDGPLSLRIIPAI